MWLFRGEDWVFEVSGSSSSRAITFIFELIPSGKQLKPLITPAMG